nr:unnamed protein product [Spirometra erinaceieuropaei]
MSLCSPTPNYPDGYKKRQQGSNPNLDAAIVTMKHSFWHCPNSPSSHDGIYVLRTIVLSVGLLASICTLALLCLLSGRTRTTLTMLRALMFSGAVCNFLELCNQQQAVILPPSTNNLLGASVCAVWLSGFLNSALHLFESLVLVYMVGNRAIQIAFKYQYSFPTSACVDVVCAGITGLACFLFALPQCFTVAWQEGHCKCLEKDLSYWLMTVIYAASFVRQAVDTLLSATALGISNVKILLWVRNTPPEKLVDTLNSLTFSNTPNALRKEFDRPQGWWTASMCMVALSINFLLLTVGSSVQRLLCAAGVFLLEANSYATRVGDLLRSLHRTTAPFIVVIYIPALRRLIKDLYWSVVASFRLRVRKIPTLTAGQIEVAQ